MNFLIELAGWAGMALVVGAFFLVSRKKFEPDGRTYLAMNVAGSVLIGIDVYFDRSWPALALQIVWASVAISSLLKPLWRPARPRP